MRGVFILGAGGYAKQIHVVYADKGQADSVLGFLEENSRKVGQSIYGKDVLDSSELKNVDSSEVMLINGMGSPLRKRWIDSLEKSGFSFDTLVHPRVILRDSIVVGTGTAIFQGNAISADVSIGKHSIVNGNSLIGHDCVLGNYVTIGPGSNIAGNVTISDGAWIGIGSTIIEKINIGENSFIGAGSLIVRDVPPNTLAYGVPAKLIRKITDDDLAKLI